MPLTATGKISKLTLREQFRDHDPSMKPVIAGFDELVDPATVRTYFTHAIPGEHQ